MPSLRRCYRILGLPPGAPKADVKRAYLDLVQVWHPDRFAHNPRLQKKAEANVKRINEAYEALKDHEPSAQTVPRNWLSESYSAIVDLGDLLKTSAFNQREARHGTGVVGFDPVKRTRGARARRRGMRRLVGLLFGILAAVAVAVLAWLLVDMIA